MNLDTALIEPDETIYFTADGPVVVEKPKPEVCPECWNEKKPDGDRCMQAVRSMCG